MIWKKKENCLLLFYIDKQYKKVVKKAQQYRLLSLDDYKILTLYRIKYASYQIEIARIINQHPTTIVKFEKKIEDPIICNQLEKLNNFSQEHLQFPGKKSFH